MKRALTWIAAGVALYAVALLATLPAGWGYHWAKAVLGDAAALSGLGGSVWDGSARRAQLGPFALERLHWELRPWALLLGRVDVALEFRYAGQPGRLALSRWPGGTLVARDVELLLPASDFQSLLRLPGAELGGAVAVALERLVVEHGRITAAAGRVGWERAAVLRPVPAQLGGFTLELENADDGVKGVLRDQGEAVQAEGLFTMANDGKYRFTASFASRDPRQPAIAQGLQLFGQPGADGRVRVDSQGVLPPLLPGAG